MNEESKKTPAIPAEPLPDERLTEPEFFGTCYTKPKPPVPGKTVWSTEPW